MNRDQKITLSMIAVMYFMIGISGVAIATVPTIPTYVSIIFGFMIGLTIGSSIFAAGLWDRIGRDL